MRAVGLAYTFPDEGFLAAEEGCEHCRVALSEVYGAIGRSQCRDLSVELRYQLASLIRSGNRAAQLLTKARILLKADVSEAGEGWSDARIAEALDTSVATIERTRRQLVEEGFEAALTRKYNPNSARPRIFDGAAEAKLIALACGPAPAGCARWTLSLLEEKVVELNIVEKASDNTIGRTLKKTSLSRTSNSNG